MRLTDIDGNIMELGADDVKNVLSVDNTLTGEPEEGLTGIVLHDGNEVIVQGNRGDIMKQLLFDWGENFTG